MTLDLEKTYAAVLFDMDGTLLDSSAVVERVWRDWSARHGLDAEAVLARSHGRRGRDTAAEFAPPGLDIEAEAEWLNDQEVADIDGIVAIGGVASMLAGLAPGRWAVVTSAGRDLALRRFAAAGLPLPDIMVTAEMVGHGKPDPEGYLLAASLLGVAAGDCLVFEDAPAGIAAGLASGADVVAIRAAWPEPFDPGCPSIEDYTEIRFRLG